MVHKVAGRSQVQRWASPSDDWKTSSKWLPFSNERRIKGSGSKRRGIGSSFHLREWMSELRFTSHQQRGHTETGPWFKVSSERLKKPGIDLAIPGLLVQHVIHGTTNPGTGPWFKVSSERLKKPGIDLAIPGLIVQRLIHWTTNPGIARSIPNFSSLLD